MTALVEPDMANVAWSFESPNTFFHYYEHPTRDEGGNPCTIYVHGGAGTVNDARFLTYAGGRPQCVVFAMMTQVITGADDVHMDFIALNLDQLSTYKPHPLSAKGNSWKTAAGYDADGIPSTAAPTFPDASYPDGRDILGAGNVDQATWKLQPAYSIGRFGSMMVVNQLKRAIVAIKSRAEVYGGDLPLNPNKLFLLGTSYGGWQALASQAQPPLIVPLGAALSAYEWFPMQPGVTSQVRGVINWYGHPDVRTGPQQVLDNGGDADDEVLPPLLLEGFLTRLVDEHEAFEVTKERLSAQYFMESGQTRWLPPVIHMMFATELAHTYPLGTPYHQKWLGIDAVRYGGSVFSQDVVGTINRLRGQSVELFSEDGADFNANTSGGGGSDGKRMAYILNSWTKQCLSDS